MQATNKQKTQRSFVPGQEWLYYKFYTGGKMGDKIVTQLILPLTNELEQRGLLDKWFFIRYTDESGKHIRFRIRVKDVYQIGEVMVAVQEKLNPFVEKRWIWKVQTDTYQRELERYGFHAVEQAEEIFYHNSKMIANLLTFIESDEDEGKRWKICLVGIDKLFQAFGYSLEQKHYLMQIMKNAFVTEFKVDKKLREQLDKKYETHKTEIDNLFSAQVFDGGIQALLPMINIVDHFTGPIAPIAGSLRQLDEEGSLEVLIHDLLWSYIHMFVNRLFKSKQRLHELVLYDFLFNQYDAKLNQGANNNTNSILAKTA